MHQGDGRVIACSKQAITRDETVGCVHDELMFAKRGEAVDNVIRLITLST